MKRNEEAKTSQGGVNHTLAAFFHHMWTAYKELERSLMVLALGEGAELEDKPRSPLPIPRPHLKYSLKAKWPGDEITSSLQKAESALTHAWHLARALHTDAAISTNLAGECWFVVAETMAIVTQAKQTAQRARRAGGQTNKQNVRIDAIHMLADLRLFDGYQKIWQSYLVQLKFDAELSAERARTYEVQTKMYKARGKTQAATRAKKRAEKERDAAINKQRELEKAYAEEKVYADLGRTFHKIPGYTKSLKDNPKKPRQSHSVEQLREVDRRRAKGEKVMSACREVMADKLGREPTEKEVENLRQAYYSRKKRQPPKV